MGVPPHLVSSVSSFAKALNRSLVENWTRASRSVGCRFKKFCLNLSPLQD